MNRNSIHRALVLRVRQAGGPGSLVSNRFASFLTADAGICEAMLFGGPKSKLRSSVSPAASGTLYLYMDSAKDRSKVTDFDVAAWRPGLRESYDRSRAASAVLETVLATSAGGGDWERSLKICEASLDELENACDNFCPHIVTQFLWTWTMVLGIRPEGLSLKGRSETDAHALVTNLLGKELGRKLPSWDW